MSTFNSKFAKQRIHKSSLLCVGLDPDPQRLPRGYDPRDIIKATDSFLKDVILATQDFAIAYKPNLAYYEALGHEGWKLFEEIVAFIKKEAADTLIIADAKRGDVGHTAEFYARAFFEDLECDAITLSPYMGRDALEPFARYEDRACIVLCNTSNPDASRFQNYGAPPLYLEVARDMQDYNQQMKNIWLVVGATRDSENIRAIKAAAPELPLLVPGIGAQGGDLQSVLTHAGDDVLINVGRSILYATDQRDMVPELTATAARDFVHQIQNIRAG